MFLSCVCNTNLASVVFHVFRLNRARTSLHLCRIQLHNMEFVRKCQFYPLPTKRGPQNWVCIVFKLFQNQVDVAMSVLSSRFCGCFA